MTSRVPKKKVPSAKPRAPRPPHAHIPGAVPLRRAPRQRRSEATLAAIAEAAEVVIAKRGYARATTNEIAARAGVSIGSLYQYFPNKEAVLKLLVERHMAQLAPIIDRALGTLADDRIPMAVALEAMFRQILTMHGDRPELNRVLGEHAPLPPVLEKMQREGEQAIARRVEAVLRKRRDVRSGDHWVMANVLAQSSEALSRWLHHDAPPSIDKDVFVRESVEMLVRYVAL